METWYVELAGTQAALQQGSYKEVVRAAKATGRDILNIVSADKLSAELRQNPALPWEYRRERMTQEIETGMRELYSSSPEGVPIRPPTGLLNVAAAWAQAALEANVPKARLRAARAKIDRAVSEIQDTAHAHWGLVAPLDRDEAVYGYWPDGGRGLHP